MQRWCCIPWQRARSNVDGEGRNQYAAPSYRRYAKKAALPEAVVRLLSP